MADIREAAMGQSKLLLPVLLFASMLLAACGSSDERKAEVDASRVYFPKVRAAPAYADTAKVAEMALTGEYYLEPRPLSKTEGMAIITDVIVNFDLSNVDLRHRDGTMPEADIMLTPNAPVAASGSLEAYCSEYITGDTATGWIVLFDEEAGICNHADRVFRSGGALFARSEPMYTTGYTYTEDELLPPPGVAIEFRDLDPGGVYILDIGLSLDPDLEEFQVSGGKPRFPTEPVVKLGGLPANINPYLSAPGGHLMFSFIAEASTASLFLSNSNPQWATLLFHYAGLTKLTQ